MRKDRVAGQFQISEDGTKATIDVWTADNQPMTLKDLRGALNAVLDTLSKEAADDLDEIMSSGGAGNG